MLQLCGSCRPQPDPSPFQFHYDHNRAQFYVEDATTASALKQVSRKITDRDNYKVCAFLPLRRDGRGWKPLPAGAISQRGRSSQHVCCRRALPHAPLRSFRRW